MTRRRRRELELQRTVAGMLAGRRREPLPLLLWNWRKELAILTCAALLFVAVAGTFGIPWVIVALAALTGVLSPPWSQRFRAGVWQFVTPHLLRSGMYQAGIQNRNGRRPLIVRVTVEPFGERIRLRCPAGICAEDIEAEREVLRAACWAADVRVTRDERRSHLVTVDVIRRRDGAGHPDCLRDPRPG